MLLGMVFGVQSCLPGLDFSKDRIWMQMKVEGRDHSILTMDTSLDQPFFFEYTLGVAPFSVTVVNEGL